MSALDLAPVYAELRSRAAATGWFTRDTGHEPKNAPGSGITVAFWLQSIAPIPARSGLAVTSLRVEIHARVYVPMVREPQDDTDPLIAQAATALMSAFTADFDLGGLVAEVDLLGAHGAALTCNAGYFTHDGVEYRALVITVPLIFNDVFVQAA